MSLTRKFDRAVIPVFAAMIEISAISRCARIWSPSKRWGNGRCHIVCPWPAIISTSSCRSKLCSFANCWMALAANSPSYMAISYLIVTTSSVRIPLTWILTMEISSGDVLFVRMRCITRSSALSATLSWNIYGSNYPSTLRQMPLRLLAAVASSKAHLGFLVYNGYGQCPSHP
jgi:hypothetical protein